MILIDIVYPSLHDLYSAPPWHPHFASLQLKLDFFAMLEERDDIDKHTRWSKIKDRMHKDSRYKAVDHSSQREDWFKEYQETKSKVSYQ